MASSTTAAEEDDPLAQQPVVDRVVEAHAGAGRAAVDGDRMPGSGRREVAHSLSPARSSVLSEVVRSPTSVDGGASDPNATSGRCSADEVMFADGARASSPTAAPSG